MISALSLLSGSFSGISSTTAKSRSDEMFARMDTNSDGKIDATEFEASRPSSPNGDTVELSDDLFAKIDTDGDGYMSKAENEAFSAKMEEAMKNRSDEMFAKMDTNGDGTVDATEFETFISQAPKQADNEKSSEDMFAEIDTNGDGSISKTEFADFSAKMPPPPPMNQGSTSISSATDTATKTLLDYLDEVDDEKSSSPSSLYSQFALYNEGNLSSLLDVQG